jgi:hypothetical protein
MMAANPGAIPKSRTGNTFVDGDIYRFFGKLGKHT